MQRSKGKEQNGKDHRLLQKKPGSVKGTFHAMMGTIKDRDSKDLTEDDDRYKG